MASVRALAQCLGIRRQTFSVMENFMGFVRVPLVIPQPRPTGGFGAFGGFGTPRRLRFWGLTEMDPPRHVSLRDHIRSLRRQHVHLNIIRVAYDALDREYEVGLNQAIHHIREIYAQVGLGVGRIGKYHLTVAKSGGFDDLADTGEATDLTNAFGTGNENDGIDVFTVRQFHTAGGWSVIDGPCPEGDKDNCIGPDAAVVLVGGLAGEKIGQIAGHEVGHYLGLDHWHFVRSPVWPNEPMAVDEDENNLMNAHGGGEQLRPDQGAIMRDHCIVRGGCTG